MTDATDYVCFGHCGHCGANVTAQNEPLPATCPFCYKPEWDDLPKRPPILLSPAEATAAVSAAPAPGASPADAAIGAAFEDGYDKGYADGTHAGRLEGAAQMAREAADLVFADCEDGDECGHTQCDVQRTFARQILALAPADVLARLDRERDELRGGDAGPWPACHDCGRAMVWESAERSLPSWMCPACVLQRCKAAESALAEARAALTEKSALDAPRYYSSAAASGWADGYNSCAEAVSRALGATPEGGTTDG